MGIDTTLCPNMPSELLSGGEGGDRFWGGIKAGGAGHKGWVKGEVWGGVGDVSGASERHLFLVVNTRSAKVDRR